MWMNSTFISSFDKTKFLFKEKQQGRGEVRKNMPAGSHCFFEKCRSPTNRVCDWCSLKLIDWCLAINCKAIFFLCWWMQENMVAQRYHGNFLSIHDNMTKLFPSVKKFFLHDKIFRSAKTFIVRERAGHNHACVHKKMALPGRCGFRD